MSDRAGLPASYDDDIAREPVYTTESACADCGYEPGYPWGWNAAKDEVAPWWGECSSCDNPYCPRGRSDDDG